MDSRSGFAVLLVVAGIAIVWLALTGKAQAIIAAVQGSAATPAPTSSTAPAPSGANMGGSAGGSWSPTSATNAGGVIAAAPSDLLAGLSYASLFNNTGSVNATPYTGPLSSKATS